MQQYRQILGKILSFLSLCLLKHVQKIVVSVFLIVKSKCTDLDKVIADTEGDAPIELVQVDDDEKGEQKLSVVEMEVNDTPLDLTAVAAADTTGVTAVVFKMDADETSSDVASADTSSHNEATTTTSTAAAAAATTAADTTAVAATTIAAAAITLAESIVANSVTMAVDVDTS
ncbi:hypothetical protein TSAR_015358 [Trichomalopsis sarcophagae]|uniref:Uncharacterized protein n=1 Tax=Trichomalopsis sarcophagae TaxID=543379 RepID=A0A232ESF4_9HYME|nr:hypothetical protein TSAR_015358 [Trichomalopsis sarcophagae]